MLFDEGDEVRGGVTGESGFGKVRISGEKILRRAMKVGEIGAATAGDENFAPEAIGTFEQGDAAAAPAAFGGAKEASGAAAEDEDVELADGAGDGGEMVTEGEQEATAGRWKAGLVGYTGDALKRAPTQGRRAQAGVPVLLRMGR